MDIAEQIAEANAPEAEAAEAPETEAPQAQPGPEPDSTAEAFSAAAVAASEDDAAAEGEEPRQQAADADPQGEPEPEPEATPEEIELEHGVKLVRDANGARVLNMKVDGRVIEEMDVDELVRGYQRGAGATRRFQEAAKIENSAKAVLSELQSGDPRRMGHVLKQIGVDLTEVAERHLTALLEESQLPPEQRALRDVEREKAELQRQREEFQRAQRDAQIAAESARIQEQYEAELSAAFERSGVTPSPAARAEVLAMKRRALEVGYDMPWEDAVAELKGRLPTEPAAPALPDDPDELAALLGEERVKAILAKRAAAIRSTPKRAPKVNKQRRNKPRRPVVDMRDPDAVRSLWDS